MKKFFAFMLFAAVLFGAASCGKEDATSSVDGEQVEVTFNAKLTNIGTRAFGEAKKITTLRYLVFDAVSKTPITRLGGVISTDEGTTHFEVSMTLIKGVSYDILFWADSGNNIYSIDQNTGIVTVDYTDAVANDETRDAFYGVKKNFNVSSSDTDVTLRRPFAQLNVLTTDIAAAKDAAVVEIFSELTTTTYSTLNPFAGEGQTDVDGATEVTFSQTACPDFNGGYLSVNYLLVPATKRLINVEYLFMGQYTENGEPFELATLNLTNIPVQRNYKTNIKGSLLTDDTKFNVDIEAEWQSAKYILSGGEVTLTENLVANNIVVKEDTVLNLNSFNVESGIEYVAGLTGTDIAAITIENGATLTIKGEGTIKGTSYGVYAKDGNLIIEGGNYTAETSAVQVSNAKVEIKAGTFAVTGDDKRYVINCLDADYKAGRAVVEITGGTFEAFNPQNNAAEGQGTNFCAKYYKATQTGDYYEVVADFTLAATLDDVKSVFATGGNLVLADDIQFDGMASIEPGAEVHLDLNGKTINVDQNTTSNTLIWVKDGAKLVIDGNGTIDLEAVTTMVIFAPYGELVIENGTFIRDKVTSKPSGLFMGVKLTSSNVTINGGYFDSGYYNADSAYIDEILAGTMEFEETADDIAKRGNSKDTNKVRVALKENAMAVFNYAGYGPFKIYGGTFVGANPAWGDEGCMLPTTPNYLRPWSYYQGPLLAGQAFNPNGIVLPEGYSIEKGATADGRPTYTVTFSGTEVQ